MKYFVLVILIIASVSCKQKPTATGCSTELWNHVYHQSRFTVYNDCMEVKGLVMKVHYCADGDAHIQLKPDNEYAHLLNDKNRTAQNNCLVLEVICASSVTQDNAKESCEVFTNAVKVPRTGDVIIAKGTYVHDTKHGWNEIHPVSSLSITGHKSPELSDKNPVVGKTKTGIPIHKGPRGGLYHYSKSGKKVYEKKKK